jgi:hypothetical protein
MDRSEGSWAASGSAPTYNYLKVNAMYVKELCNIAMLRRSAYHSSEGPVEHQRAELRRSL